MKNPEFKIDVWREKKEKVSFKNFSLTKVDWDYRWRGEREREREREREIALVPWSGGPMASTFECHVTT